jgi:hypothetical protein
MNPSHFPSQGSLPWTHSENFLTSERTRKIINLSLIAVQIVGLVLLFTSLPGSTQLIPMNETLLTRLVISGGIILVSGSMVWSDGNYHKREPMKKIGIGLAALSALTIAVGVIAFNGLIPGISLPVARCLLGAGSILALPLLFPYGFTAGRACMSRMDHCLDRITKKHPTTSSISTIYS